MESVLFWGIIIVVIVATVYIIYRNHENKLNKKVDGVSLRIKELKQLNETIRFNKIDENIYISKHYDNKSNYNKIEPAYLMAAELRENIENYSIYIRLIQENREKEIKYFKKIDEILEKKCFVDYSVLQMSEKSYKKRELKLFDELILPTYTNCNFEVVMSYSSPKGRVNLSKSDVFDFEQMLVSFNSISRSYLDRETYKKLSKVERGEVSDSLRYDVMNRDGFRCVICGASANEGVRLHVDHIIPIAKGGKSSINNLRTLCERCNVGKSDKIETGFSKDQNDDQLCPLCKGKLVLRNGRYGKFYGCENYPKCRFVKNVE